MIITILFSSLALSSKFTLQWSAWPDAVQVVSTLSANCTCNFNGMFCIQQRLQLLTESYLENGEEPFTVDILKEMTSKYLAVRVFETPCITEHFKIYVNLYIVLFGMTKSFAFSNGKAAYVYFTAMKT